MRKNTPLTLEQFEEFLRLLPARADSEHSWTVELDERKRVAAEDARPHKETATAKGQQAAQWSLRLADLKRANPRDDQAIEKAQARVADLTREARDAASKAREIEDAVYDLKAVNLHRKPEAEERTVEELLEIISAEGARRWRRRWRRCGSSPVDCHLYHAGRCKGDARVASEGARYLKSWSYALCLAYRDPRVPWYTRLFALCVVAYAFSPIDLVPDFVPVLGYLDDLILIPMGISLAMRMIPRPVLDDCRLRAETMMATDKPTNWVAAAAIAAHFGSSVRGARGYPGSACLRLETPRANW